MRITACTPTIPPRTGPGGLLEEAVASVRAQTFPALGGISVALDVDRQGAAATRQRALDAVRTEWVAFLDDDDLWYPNHLQVLSDLARETGADYVWSWFDGNVIRDWATTHRGKQMDPNAPHHTTMTVMVRTDLAKQVGFADHPDAPPQWSGEDWLFTLGCIEAGATFAHTPEVTWHYRVHGGNTSGRPDY